MSPFGRKERFLLFEEERSRPKIFFFFFVFFVPPLSLRFFLFRVGGGLHTCTIKNVKSASFCSAFLRAFGLAFVLGKRGGLSPSQHEDDDDDVNENDDWVCKNNDHCFHPDFIIVIVFVAKKFKDHL